VTLRKVPGALALGLLASLAAHAALFGDDHAMGGTFHALLVQAALAGAVSFAVFFGALASSESSAAADGSIVAARLRDRLPNIGMVIAFAVLWYGFAERVEPHHAGCSPLFAAVVLAAAAWLVLRLAGFLAGVVSAAVLALQRDAFAPRAPSWPRRSQPRPFARRTRFAYRRFARPPPIIAASRA
jgi:hypothetical protein